MSGNEVTYLSQAARETRGTELEGKIRKIIRQSFTPADANRNATFKALMEELATLRNQYLPSLYNQFEVPMSSDMRSKFGMFGGHTRTPSAPVAPRPATYRRNTYVPSAEAQAIIDAVHARKHEDAPDPVQEVKHVTGKLAKQRSEEALKLIGTPAAAKTLKRSDGKGMRGMRTFGKPDEKTLSATSSKTRKNRLKND